MGATREKLRTVESPLGWVQNFISKWKQNNKTKQEATKSEMFLFSAVEDTWESTYEKHIHNLSVLFDGPQKCAIVLVFQGWK